MSCKTMLSSSGETLRVICDVLAMFRAQLVEQSRKKFFCRFFQS